MESTQKPSTARTMRPKPTLQIDGLSRAQPPGEAYTIDDWIPDHPEQSPDVDGGIVKDLMTLALRYVERIELDTVKHQDALSVLGEHRRKMLLWIDSDGKLDRRLAEAPEMRDSFVSNLVPLVLGLQTGINLVTPETRHDLLEDTNRVVEQASKIAPVHLQALPGSEINNILEFHDAKKLEITSRIENVSDLLSAIHHLGASFDEEPSPQIEETGFDEHRPFGPDKSFKEVRRQSKRSHSSLTSVVGASSTSQGAENSGRAHSDPSKSSSKHLSRSTKSPSISSKSSDDGSHRHIRPSADTATSMSLSETKMSSGETATSISSRPSAICKNCNAFLKEHEGEYESRVLGEQVIEIEMIMPVTIRHRENKRFVDKTMLIDTGCDRNFIRPSLVKELGLDVVRLTTPISLEGFAKNVFQVNEAVIPEWRFSEGWTMHQEITFYVLSDIPGRSDIVLGNKARRDMSIHLCMPQGALVAYEDLEDNPTQEESKLKRRKQIHDIMKTDNNTMHAIEARLVGVVQQNQAAAKASNNTKSQSATSQRDPGGSGDA